MRIRLIKNTISTQKKAQDLIDKIEKSYHKVISDNPVLVGGIGNKTFGTQYRQGNRVYSSDNIAMCLTAQPVGNTGGNSYLYLVN